MSAVTERWWHPEESEANALLIRRINVSGGPEKLLAEIAHLREQIVRERALRLAAETARDAAIAALRVTMRSLHDATQIVIAFALTSRGCRCVVCTEHPRTEDVRPAAEAQGGSR